MGTPKTCEPGSRWARCARQLGVDRNPLRRPADRIEAALRFAVLILIIAGVPIATIAVGRTVDHLTHRHIQAQQAADHQIRAVLTQDARPTGAPDPYSNVPMTWVLARWTAPNGTVHSGQILAPVGLRKGSTARTWVTRSGAATGAPETQRDVRLAVFVAVMSTLLILLLVLVGLQVFLCHLLNRRRIGAWDAEWRTVGPQWARHRPELQ